MNKLTFAYSSRLDNSTVIGFKQEVKVAACEVFTAKETIEESLLKYPAV